MPSRTLCILKPDCLERKLVGLVIAWLERDGLSIVAGNVCRPHRAFWEDHYAEHVGKPFMPALLDFMTSGLVIAMVLEHAGPDAYKVLRNAMGPFAEPRPKSPATIRACHMIVGEDTFRNLVHGSDSPESAAREIDLWFPELSDVGDEAVQGGQAREAAS